MDLTYGRHAVEAMLSHDVSGEMALFFQENRKDERTLQILEQAEHHQIPIHPVSRTVLDEMTDGMRHQGFVLRCANPEPIWQPDHLPHLVDSAAEPALLLVLDGVQDPHNLGACLRSADGAGAHAVVSPRNRAVGLTPAVRKVASGAAKSVPFIQIVNLVRTLDELRAREVKVVGLASEADKSLYDIDLTGPIALVLGGEEKGLRRLTRENCDHLVRLPMLGATESLNVSVAAGICLYEIRRQRGMPHKDTVLHPDLEDIVPENPEDTVPEDTIREDLVSGNHPPKDDDLENATLEDVVSEHEDLEDIVPEHNDQDNTQEDVIPEDIVPEDIISEDIVPEDIVPEGIVNEDTDSER
uniref:23S rRNA (guanosine-2'-O-)-methyltransferase RlmB n=1 Tax=Candidatus Kentrum sp. MB TaxID=2138164 RepID=A0A450XYV3_9GAMM|nr:MAG: rRNA methylase, putative, group 3 [Candidatus Kentron sp. MB]VFK76767.1 MAG: rRNA methylase, putative, group 3 [Candidatus Kentron sp. MB]